MATRAPVQEISHLLPTTLGRHKRPSTINVSDTADLVVDWLLRLSAANVAQPRAEAVYAWRLLEASAGTASVAYLARAVGLSHRQFNAVFTQANGLKPKLAARLLRFGRFIELLAGDDTATLGEMAYVCGYSDQSHLTREAQALAAISPAALSAARLPALQGFEINRFG